MDTIINDAMTDKILEITKDFSDEDMLRLIRMCRNIKAHNGFSEALDEFFGYDGSEITIEDIDQFLDEWEAKT